MMENVTSLSHNHFYFRAAKRTSLALLAFGGEVSVLTVNSRVPAEEILEH